MELGETIAIAIANLISESKEDCWYCKEKPEKTEIQNQLNEDPDSLGLPPPENDLKNASSRLGENLGLRPNWIINKPNSDNKTEVVPGAHHLIPGNASLNKAKTLLKYIKKGDKINGDIGYDVNCRENGVWLPGNYGVREGASDFKIKWSQYQYQEEYAINAMKKANAQFHDAHNKYSQRVLKTLEEIAGKIVVNMPDKCPVCKNTVEDKARPPYGLVGRLNACSRHHRRFLSGSSRKWPVQSGYFTSKHSKLLVV